jgi:hypothetical protein
VFRGFAIVSVGGWRSRIGGKEIWESLGHQGRLIQGICTLDQCEAIG